MRNILLVLSNNNVYVIFDVAGFRPGRRFTFVSAKVNKTIDAQFDLIKIGRTRDTGGRSNSLRSNKARQEKRTSVPVVEQQASETNAHHTMDKVAGMPCTEGAEQMTNSILLKKQTGRIPITYLCNSTP